jgi:hypothetical protein
MGAWEFKTQQNYQNNKIFTCDGVMKSSRSANCKTPLKPAEAIVF